MHNACKHGTEMVKQKQNETKMETTVTHNIDSDYTMS